MTAKRKRPKVRHFADGSLIYGIRGHNFQRIGQAESPSIAKRIAAALNLAEAVRRGEL